MTFWFGTHVCNLVCLAVILDPGQHSPGNYWFPVLHIQNTALKPSPKQDAGIIQLCPSRPPFLSLVYLFPASWLALAALLWFNMKSAFVSGAKVGFKGSKWEARMMLCWPHSHTRLHSDISFWDVFISMLLLISNETCSCVSLLENQTCSRKKKCISGLGVLCDNITVQYFNAVNVWNLATI